MKLENIKVGEVYTYSELCKLLEEKEKAGNSKISQTKEWDRYFSYYHPINPKTKKESKKFHITEIFDTPKEKIDNRKNNGGHNKGARKVYDCIIPTNEEIENNIGVYIIYNDDEVYIGSTITSFKRRFQDHNSNIKSPAYDLLHNKGGRFDILWKAPSGCSEKVIRSIEEEYINEYVAKDNRTILNTAMTTFIYKNRNKEVLINNQEEELMNGKKYIYNVEMANFFMQEGVKCLGTGIHRTTKRVYYIFGYNECQEAYEKWNKLIKEQKSQKVSNY